jgi:hypothetical protein
MTKRQQIVSDLLAIDDPYRAEAKVTAAVDRLADARPAEITSALADLRADGIGIDTSRLPAPRR